MKIILGSQSERSGAFDHQHSLVAKYVEWIEGEPESVTGLPRSLAATLIQSVW